MPRVISVQVRKPDELDRTTQWPEKALLVAVDVKDRDRNQLVPGAGWFTSSSVGDFAYVTVEGEGEGLAHIPVTLPPEAVTATLTIRTWGAKGRGWQARLVSVNVQSLPELAAPLHAHFEATHRESLSLHHATGTAILPVLGGQDYLANVHLEGSIKRGSKPGLVAVQWFDDEGRQLASRGQISNHPRLGEHRYLTRTGDVPNRVLLKAPLGATTVWLTVHPWDRGEELLKVRNQFTFSLRRPEIATPPKKLADLVIAVVCDEFTYNSFSPEARLIPLEPTNWREQLEANPPDLFLCESAWAGVDSRARPWRGKVYASKNFPRENRTDLIGIIEHCRDLGVPTVFWNKEDPAHYDDRIHDFVATALLFDHIFTTAEECVERYRSDYGHPSVHTLPFATQPRHFNPIEYSKRSDDVIFAGSWYAQHPDRCAAMNDILDGIVDSGRGLQIYDRQSENDDPNHEWPIKYRPLVRPGVTHVEMASLYKASAVALNINTVTDSQTMFARRVFELMSSNTLVLSNYSVGMEAMFGELVVFVDRDPERLDHLSKEQQEGIRSKALELVLRKHTYRSRIRFVAGVVGLPVIHSDPEVAVAVKVTGLAHGRAMIRALREAGPPLGAVLLVLAESVDPLEVQRCYRELPGPGVEVVDPRLVQDGAKINMLKDAEDVLLLSDVEQLDVPRLREALLHRQYVSDPILLDNVGQTRYRYCDEATVESVLVQRRDLDSFIGTIGGPARGVFYAF